MTLPVDVPDLFKCVQGVEKYCGNQDIPSLFKPPVVLALTAFDEESGEVVDGCYIEMIALVSKLGFTKRGVESFEELKPALVSFLQARKIRVVQVQARKRFSRFLKPIYERIGFKDKSGYAFFQGRI